ncbi:hypothetical protein LTR84_005485 [Exophiala bonariae]|uniref:Major facilitator superfamily (MFS) profile domain-containing protein n=1 Tax=Exophiala bonariae TaxID=1690606 RepID=A0AAV9N539_9EURO|nr:hypothetical protein LTR84_005485 [Exophiala bonariae]
MALNKKLRLTRPFNQNFAVACMLFCLPGMYNAITGLGAGGGKPSSLEVANNVNAIIYVFLGFGSLVVGFLLNKLTPKVCLMIGATGYPLYIGGLWYYDRSGNQWFVYLAGVLNGISGAFLWVTAAFVQFSYPEEKNKGLYISMQWAMRSVGATCGSFIAFGANFHATKAVGVSTPVYVAFILIQSVAFFIALFCIVDPERIVRDDGTHIAIFQKVGIVQEIKGLCKAAIDTRYIILAIPMFCCEMALGLLSSVNSRSFNLRTRALNNLSFNMIQMFLPPLLTLILDNKYINSRRARGYMGVALTGTIASGGAAGLIAWIELNKIDESSKPRAWDWTDGMRWGPLFVCYLCFGCTYAGYQMVTEYTLSSTTNDPEQLSKVAGLFKFYSSLGMFLSFIMAGQHVPFYGQASVQLCLYFLGSFCILYILWRKVLETNYFSETNVIVPHAIEEHARLEGKIVDTGAQEQTTGAEEIKTIREKATGN